MRILKWLLAVLGALTLAACGGGGGSSGTSLFGTGSGTTGTGTGTGTGSGTTGTSTTLSIVLSISKTTITVGSPATLTATVTTSGGAAAVGQVVNFSTVSGLGSFSAPSALTDADGKAAVQLSPASTSSNGADLAVATLVAASGSTTSTPSATIGFQATPGGTSPSAGTPTLSVALASTSVTSTTPVALTATLRDANGAPVAGQIVKFSTVDNLGTFNVPSALTDANGRAAAQLSPATTSTNGADLAVATATVNGTLVTGSAAFSVASVAAPVVGTPSIALSLSTTSVTAATPATVTAFVRDASGAGVAGQVVKFRTIDGLGTLNVASALTDATGSASVTLSATAAGSSGADQVVASTTVNGAALQSSLGFRLTAPNVTIAGFASDVAALGAYGQTSLTVTLAGTTTGTPSIVSVSSACAAKGKASLTPSSATTTTGSAVFTYRDLGCGATDPLDSLQASISGASATRTLSIGLTSPAVGSINFVSASPSTVYLKGTGLVENSTVLFRVLDSAGNPLAGQSVQLEPSTLAGGLTIDGGAVPVTKVSDSLGNVSVRVNSGTVPTPVRIKATLTAQSISTVSSNLSIAVGLPSQLNFSLSQTTINIEGYDIDGTTNNYSIIASDRLGNPVPDGTAINFITEGGQVEASKVTALQGGLARASAGFVSSSPRPVDGRVTVVAYALGEESFLDVNGNNTYDAGEDFQDLGDIFLDRLFDGSYDAATDQRISLLLPGAAASTSACASASSSLLAPQPRFIPSRPGSCDGVWGRAYVRRATETVLSTSVARLFWTSPVNLYASTAAGCGVTTLQTEPEKTPASATATVKLYAIGGMTLYGVASSGTVSFRVADNNPKRLNPVAAGSTIDVTATTGLTVSVAGGSPVPSTAEATFASVQYEFTTGTSGTITVRVKSPSGLTTAIPINLTTAAQGLTLYTKEKVTDLPSGSGTALPTNQSGVPTLPNPVLLSRSLFDTLDVRLKNNPLDPVASQLANVTVVVSCP